MAVKILDCKSRRKTKAGAETKFVEQKALRCDSMKLFRMMLLWSGKQKIIHGAKLHTRLCHNRSNFNRFLIFCKNKNESHKLFGCCLESSNTEPVFTKY